MLRSGKALSSVIVPETLTSMLYLCAAEPASALMIAARSVPGPESASDVTSKLKLESTVRSSRRSNSSRSFSRRRASAGWARANPRNDCEVADHRRAMASKGDIGGSYRHVPARKIKKALSPGFPSDRAFVTAVRGPT